MRFVTALIALFFSCLTYWLLPADCPELARRTACIFILAACFWAFEIIPLYATSLLVVLLLTFWLPGISGEIKPSHTYEIFLSLFAHPIIILFLGGFVLAAMIRKYLIDQMMVSHLLKLFGEKPFWIMLGFMVSTAFLSFWMSHTAATALMLGLIHPILSNLSEKDLFRKALVLSIPFAANIGGIGTPVGTPPNAIAVGMLADQGMKIDFLSWMMMAVPLVVILLLVASFILILMFPPKKDSLYHFEPKIAKLDLKAKTAFFIFILTIALWVTSDWHGFSESMVALLSVGLFAGLQLMDKEDLNQIHWDVLILMWGGFALGKAIHLSGLGEWVVSMPLFRHEGFWLVAAFGVFTSLISMVISNTATANLIIPLVISLPIPNQEKLIITIVVALSCSFDMVLPISTPSNALAFSTNVITASEMFRSGLIIVILAMILLLAGYPIFISKIIRLIS